MLMMTLILLSKIIYSGMEICTYGTCTIFAHILNIANEK
jgi:hypothetical protein